MTLDIIDTVSSTSHKCTEKGKIAGWKMERQIHLSGREGEKETGDNDEKAEVPENDQWKG